MSNSITQHLDLAHLSYKFLTVFDEPQTYQVPFFWHVFRDYNINSTEYENKENIILLLLYWYDQLLVHDKL